MTLLYTKTADTRKDTEVRKKTTLLLLTILICLIFTSACSTTSSTTAQVPTPTAKPTAISDSGKCPGISECYTPLTLRQAYGIQDLTRQGYTGKDQGVVVIVSFGSPTLQSDVAKFSTQYGLPALNLQVLSPLGATDFNQPGLTAAQQKDMQGWAIETALDVETIHAIAPEARVVVMTSPVSETEGTIGLPQFMQLEQYAASHHLGNVFSQSWAASEATLSDATSRQFIDQYSSFYQDLTTKQGITVLSGTGDNGATDYVDLNAKKLNNTRTINFPADLPWITAVGGTSLTKDTGTFTEVAWPGSGGGVSAFYSKPTFQQALPQSAQTLLSGHRGIPDVAADADPGTALGLYTNGQWMPVGGTSASTPLWAGLIAIANQMAGHPLGFINPALYKVAQSQTYAQDFRDVTRGNNTVDGGQTVDQPEAIHITGYVADTGWDPVTGWGTPQAQHLLPDLIQALKQTS